MRSMRHRTDDVRIQSLRPLLPPAILMEELPVSEEASALVAGSLVLALRRPQDYDAQGDLQSQIG